MRTPAPITTPDAHASWGMGIRLLHWLIAALVLVQFPLGWLARSWPLSPVKVELFMWHKSMGVLILVLACMRLVWRLFIHAPMLPAQLPVWERAAARLSHGLLYLMLIALPLSGWVTHSASGVPFRIFRQWPLPAIVAPDKPLQEFAALVHWGLCIAFAALLLVHIGAALRHHFVLRDDVLRRMLPFPRRKK